MTRLTDEEISSLKATYDDTPERHCLDELLELRTISAGIRPFQQRVAEWMRVCFGYTISPDLKERNHRFLEESLELVQSCDCTKSEALQLVEYVFNRQIGEPRQEVGGVMVTLAALCEAQAISMAGAGEVELVRVWTKISQIRKKQAAKPKNSPLPQLLETTPFPNETAYRKVLKDFLYLINLGPNDEAAVAAYELQNELQSELFQEAISDKVIDTIYQTSQGQPLRESDKKRVMSFARAIIQKTWALK